MPSIGLRSRISSALRGRWYWGLALIVTLVVWMLVALAMRPVADANGSYGSLPYGWTTGIENQAVDLLFQIREGKTALRERGRNEPIVIIEIDDQSLTAGGRRAQDWSRSDYARLIEAASSGGAAVIGLDLILAGRSQPDEEQSDRALVEAISRAGNVVLAQKSSAAGTPAIKPEPVFVSATWAVGFVDLPLDSDGFVRSSAVRLNDDASDWQLSFGVRLAEGYRLGELYENKFQELRQRGLSDEQAQSEAAQHAQREATLKSAAEGNLILGEHLLPIRPDGFFQLDYRSRPKAFRTIPAFEVLNSPATVAADFFRDRIVLIGRTSIAGGDYFATPLYEPSVLARFLAPGMASTPVRTSGVEIHATAIATMLFGASPARPTYPWQVAFVLVPLLVAALAIFRLQAWLALILVTAIAAGLLMVSSWMFNSRSVILPLGSSVLGLALLAPVGLGLHYARERSRRTETERDRALMMDIFSRCVSPAVAETLWQQRESVALQGERRIVTVIFTDIRNFTTLCEASDSNEVVEWLKDYFTRMNEIITQHGGHINKFIGDGLMIVFGAPLSRGAEEEARAAVTCGLAMLEEVTKMNRDWQGTERPQIAIGVGVHTGEATCGVVGSPQRLEYTVIGDTVNLASRLESKTKELGVDLLMSAATAEYLNAQYTLNALGEVDVKGKEVRTTVLTISNELQSD